MRILSKIPAFRAVWPPHSTRRLGGRLLRFTAYLLLAFLLLSLVLVLPLRWLDPPVSSLMLLRGGEREQVWQPLTAIAPALALAVVAAEDQKFPHHDGFDLEAMLQAYREWRAGEELRGASTISQQVSKNLYLWPGRSLLRKGLEAWFTVLIEMMWPKQRILEIYLNIVEFGDGVYGAEAASQRYFKHSAARLTTEQAALLAAVLPNPLRYQVTAPSEYVRWRQRWILRQMRQLGPAYLRSLSD